jgi:hypothetical protein
VPPTSSLPVNADLSVASALKAVATLLKAHRVEDEGEDGSEFNTHQFAVATAMRSQKSEGCATGYSCRLVDYTLPPILRSRWRTLLDLICVGNEDHANPFRSFHECNTYGELGAGRSRIAIDY